MFVELGSGGGFIKEVIPNTITSDINPLAKVDKHFAALFMPFEDSSVDAFFMIDVLHHLSYPNQFLKEVERCLKRGGKIIMIAPANTWWGRFIYQKFHHEPFTPTANWNLDTKKPLSSVNQAIPWIMFFRDRLLFEKNSPGLKY